MLEPNVMILLISIMVGFSYLKVVELFYLYIAHKIMKMDKWGPNNILGILSSHLTGFILLVPNILITFILPLVIVAVYVEENSLPDVYIWIYSIIIAIVMLVILFKTDTSKLKRKVSEKFPDNPKYVRLLNDKKMYHQGVMGYLTKKTTMHGKNGQKFTLSTFSVLYRFLILFLVMTLFSNFI